jgi:hypothetical protein
MTYLNQGQVKNIKSILLDDFEHAEFIRPLSPLIACQGWIDFEKNYITSILEHQHIFDMLLSIAGVYNLKLDWIYDKPMDSPSTDFEGVNFTLEYKSN